MKTIRSRDNAFVKQLIALAHSSRERRKAGLTVLDGIHLVRAYLDAGEVPHALAIAESVLQREEVAALLARSPLPAVNLLADALMAEASALESPAFVMAMVATPATRPTPADATVLVLEDVQDPGNVGSILRSAAAAGVGEVALSKTTAFAWSPKVLRAGQGAHFSLNIVEGVDVAAFIRGHSGHGGHGGKGGYGGQSLALVAGGHGVRRLYDVDLLPPTAFLIGNEGAGLSADVRQAATCRVTIPMPGRAESLNAAAAAAVCLFEMVRQRTVHKKR